jgi:hypothetical protein
MRVIKTFILAIMMLITGIIELIHYPLTMIIEWLNKTMVKIMQSDMENEAEQARKKLLEELRRGKDGK